MEGFIKIYRYDGTEKIEVTLTQSSKWTHSLSGEDYIELSFTMMLDEPSLEHHAVSTYFEEGDYIVNPINGQTYYLLDLTAPNENGSGYWNFTLRFDGLVAGLSRMICKYTLQESTTAEINWSLTDSLVTESGYGKTTLATNILGSMAEDFPNIDWKIDAKTYAAGIDFSETFSLTSEASKYTDIFSAICEAYDCEWWNEGTTIYFGIAKIGEEVEFVDERTDESANKLQIISTSTSKSSDDYATRLFFYGSERNIPTNYNLITGEKLKYHQGVVTTRLTLPAPGYLISENVKNRLHTCVDFCETDEDIYPHREEIVTKVVYYTDTDDDDITYNYYCIQTDNPIAAIDDFQIDASKGNLSIGFNSGDLNGREYEVQLHKSTLERIGLHNIDGSEYTGSKEGLWYEIVSDGEDIPTPSNLLYPKAGDKCQLFNWSAYDSKTKALTTPMLALIEQARQELLAVAKARFEELQTINATFTCTPAKVGISESMLFGLGQAVLVSTAPAFVGKKFSSRIRSFTVQLYNKFDRTYEVGISARYTRLNSLSDSIQSISGSVSQLSGKNSSSNSSSSSTGTDNTKLSKVKDDTTPYTLTIGQAILKKNESARGTGGSTGFLSSSDFVTGESGTGSGWQMQYSGDLEANSIKLRSFLDVPEIRFNKATVIAGTTIQSPSGGIIKEVIKLTELTGIAVLKLGDDDLAGSIMDGDLCWGYWHDFDNNSNNSTETSDDREGDQKYKGFSGVYFQVAHVYAKGDTLSELEQSILERLDVLAEGECPTNSSVFRYELGLDSETGEPLYKGLHPYVGMSFGGRGSTLYPNRQGFTILTPNYTATYQFVTDWKWDNQVAHVVRVSGLLNGFETAANVPAGTWGSTPKYGTIDQNIYYRGKIIEVTSSVRNIYITQSSNGILQPGDEQEIVSIVIRNENFTDVTSEANIYVKNTELGSIDISTDTPIHTSGSTEPCSLSFNYEDLPNTINHFNVLVTGTRSAVDESDGTVRRKTIEYEKTESFVIRKEASPTYSIEVDMGGDIYIDTYAPKHITCTVQNSLGTDMTASVTAWQITRESSDSVADDTWNARERSLAFDGSFDFYWSDDVSINDIDLNAQTTKFHITAELPDLTLTHDIII